MINLIFLLRKNIGKYKSLDFSKNKKKIAIVLLIIILVFMGLIFALTHLNGRSENQSDTQNSEEFDSGNNSGAVEAYEYKIINIDRSQNPVYVQVYTTAKSDSQLIELNDKVLPEFKDLGRNVLIGYFDDYETGKSYFQEQRQSVDNTKTSHLVASMVFLTNIDPRISATSDLTRIKDGVRVLKSY